MGASAEALRAANESILAVTAHDRAGFGGALVSNGLVVLLTALWGARRGARWLWWAFFAVGIPGFVGALGVHATAGHGDVLHLAPAVLAFVIDVASLAATRDFLRG